MKTIIAGSRTITDGKLVEAAIAESGFLISEVVCGMAPGVDTLGQRWALTHNIPVARFPARWELDGKSAGYLRNTRMAEYADALIAVTTGSSGTAHMIRTAEVRGLKVFVKRV